MAKTKVKKTKIDISKVEQTHGAFIRTRTIDELLGRTDTRSPEAYLAELNGMIDAKLHEHCLTVGLIPSGPRDRLIARLVKMRQEKASNTIAFQPKPVITSSAAQDRQRLITSGRF